MKACITIVGLALAGSSLAESDAAPDMAPLDAAYELLAVHVCSDFEYLSCLQVSEGQCRADLESQPLRACARGIYVLADQPGGNGASELPVPSKLVACVYSAHVELRGLMESEVNACMLRDD